MQWLEIEREENQQRICMSLIQFISFVNFIQYAKHRKRNSAQR